jgi:SAM-dependent methyltransferase
MNNHTDLLVFLAKRLKAPYYLEIGVQNRANNLDKIPAAVKVGVDPDPQAKADYVMTSDEFFAQWGLDRKFDLIFIDGLHHADQVARDFTHALRVLKPTGVIMLHDTNPARPEHAEVPRRTKAPAKWCGDVYKFACSLGAYDDVTHFTVDFDNGCTVVFLTPGTRGARENHPEVHTWDQFDRKLLRLITPLQFKQILGDTK